jgi:VWFA-related protein
MRRRAVALLMLAGLATLPDRPAQAQDPTRPTATLRRDVNLVSVYYTVRDSKRRLVSELTRDRFQVLEDGREQRIRNFAHHSDVPLNLGVLLDTSTGLLRLLELEADSASQFLHSVLRPNDMAFAASFSGEVRILQVPTQEPERLEAQINTIRGHARPGASAPRRPPPGGPPGTPPTVGTPPFNPQRIARLYDALRLTTSRFLAEEYGRKAVVILALADDAGSESTLEDALEVLQGHDVIVYVLQVYDGPGDPCDIVHEYNPRYLKRLADETGGRVVDVRGQRNLGAAFAQIAEELHNQYSLGYSPENQNFDGRFRKLEIKVRGGGYRVQARRGYYATPPRDR